MAAAPGARPATVTDPAAFMDLARRALGEHGTGDALRAVAALRAELDRLEALHVAEAIGAGWSWSRVARELGVTKQAAHRKHARRVRDLAALTASEAVPTEPSGPSGRVVVADEARRAIDLAREEAARAGAPALGSEHLLLGIVRVGAPPVATVLTGLGVREQELREAAGRAGDERPAATRGGRGVLSAEGRAALERALASGRREGGRLGLEQLTLAVLDDETGGAARALDALGVEAGDVRAALDSSG